MTFAQRVSQMLKNFLPGFKWGTIGKGDAYAKWQDGCFYLYSDRLVLIHPATQSTGIFLDENEIREHLMSFRVYLAKPNRRVEQTIN